MVVAIEEVTVAVMEISASPITCLQQPKACTEVIIKQNSNKFMMHPSAGGKSLKCNKIMYGVLGVNSNTYQNIP